LALSSSAALQRFLRWLLPLLLAQGQLPAALALFWGRADGVRWLVDHGASE
jgi:hypothetical protein